MSLKAIRKETSSEDKRRSAIKYFAKNSKLSSEETSKHMHRAFDGLKSKALDKAKLSKLEIRDQEYRKSRGLRDIDIKRGQVS